MTVPGKIAHTFSLSIFLGSEEEITVFCHPCNRDGLKLPANGYCTGCKEHLCQSCFNHHQKHTLSRHHTLLDKENMPQTLQLSSTPVPSSLTDHLNQRCIKHKKELIIFYCSYHKTLLCSVCATCEHTVSYCKVNYIPDISVQIIDSKEFQDILKDMDTITDKCHESTENMKILTAKSNRSLKDVLADIKTFRKEINQRLDELERQAEDAAKAIQQQNDNNLKTLEATCDDITKSLKASVDSIKHLNTSKESDRLFVELKVAEKMIKDCEQIIQQLTVYNAKVYTFKPNEAISGFLETESTLGTITHKALKQSSSPPPSVDIKPRQATHQDEIYVKTPKDKNRCRITGMALLSPDRLIITDFDNKAIKMICTVSHSVIDQLQLFTNPHDVTPVTSTILAVTMPNKNAIQFISASLNVITKKHSLKVDGYCFGISCYLEKLVVSFVTPEKVQILDINGTILTTVREEYIFGCLQYVTTSKTGIYVSDYTRGTVASLNWQGAVTGVYKSVGKSQGITLSDDDTVYICDKAECAIEEISSDCCKGKVVLNELKNPRAICWCTEQSLLYFSCSTEDKKYDNYIQIYKLSK